MDNTPNIKQVADAALARLPKHTYTIPEADKELPTDPKTVTVRQLTAGEEQQALEAAGIHKTSYAYEGTLRSLVAIDGTPVTWEDNGKVRAFEGLSSKVREQVQRAFLKISLPSTESADAFLASEKITL